MALRRQHSLTIDEKNVEPQGDLKLLLDQELVYVSGHRDITHMHR